MPAFQFKAATADGQVVKGILTGDTREQIVQELQALGRIPIRVDSAAPQAAAGKSWRLRGRRLSQQDIADTTRGLGNLLRAGLPLDRALGILTTLAAGQPLGLLLDSIGERVKGGMSLADAMETRSDVFSRFYINLLRAGEAGGALETVLDRLTEHMERSREIRDALVSALIYPAILVVVALLSILILLGYVVPQFKELFEGVGQALPLPTQIVIAVGDTLQHYGWMLLLMAAGAVWLVRRQFREPRARYRWHERFLRLPVAGAIITQIEVARFCRTLGTLLHNGVPLLKALSIVKETLGNVVIAEGVERVAGSLREGQSLAGPLAETTRFPPFAVHMIRVGEESGSLVDILLKVASIYERETQTTIKRSLALLEPILILVLGTIIAAVIISILVAILGINQLVF
jgi:general secretion pathway protein F